MFTGCTVGVFICICSKYHPDCLKPASIKCELLSNLFHICCVNKVLKYLNAFELFINFSIVLMV